MDIIVCIKRVPDTAEAAVIIDETEKGIKEERLSFDINESDNYALEEALLIKEKVGGSVTLVSVGKKEAEEVLRMGLAKGADTAIRLWDDKFMYSDAYATAKILATAIKDRKFDLILTGCIATDDGYSQVGPTLAELLGIPHATLVTHVEIKDNKVKVERELEGGLLEVVEIELPALFAIQTGINEPRYASIIGIKRAAQKEIQVMSLEELGLKDEDVGEYGSKIRLKKLFIPMVEKRAEILEGTPEEVSVKLTEILKGRGLV
ncbi:MAG TPA: electron transfer flavoprotein beta subunit/FixA family protein [bacterium (Candidatus Stahlbacteria)]|nr:electron transfer flavoprotein beta subunit/FixA family protein [Candidatus Stahlbacteria bacterium]